MKENWPLISVCILSFNRLEYLKKTIESFRETCTYPNLEYIIVDNGSEQDVVSYIKGLDFINKRVFNKDNMGMGYAMNQARKIANGEYFFNLENDWYFFYYGDWLERGVQLFEKDKKGVPINKVPNFLPLGLVKYKLGAGFKNYTNNPSLMSRKAYEDVGEYPQYGREYKYVSEDLHNMEPDYIKRFAKKYSCTLSETPCAIHIGGYTTNPNYGNKSRRKYHELDKLLQNRWKDGKWFITYQYMKLGNRWKIKKALKNYRKFEKSRNNEL